MEGRKELLAMSRRCYREELMKGTSGNLSVFDRENGAMLITPTSVDYETMTEDDPVLLTLDGEILEGRLRPSSEWRMHAEIYRAVPGIGAIVHTHSPYATALAANRTELPVVLIETSIFLGGSVGVADFAVPGTKEVGLSAVRALAGRNACLLANHGVVAIGRDLEEARLRAVYAEDAAKIYILAASVGTPVVLSEEDMLSGN